MFPFTSKSPSLFGWTLSSERSPLPSLRWGCFSSALLPLNPTFSFFPGQTGTLPGQFPPPQDMKRTQLARKREGPSFLAEAYISPFYVRTLKTPSLLLPTVEFPIFDICDEKKRVVQKVPPPPPTERESFP